MEKDRVNLFNALLPEDAENIITLLNKILILREWWIWSNREDNHEFGDHNQSFIIEGRYPTGNIILRAFFDGTINFAYRSPVQIEIDIKDKNYVVYKANSDNGGWEFDKFYGLMLESARETHEAKETAREQARQDDILAQKVKEGEELIDHLEWIVESNHISIEADKPAFKSKAGPRGRGDRDLPPGMDPDDADK